MSETPKKTGPVLFDLDEKPKPKPRSKANVQEADTAALTPATAPAVPDLDVPVPTGQAMQTLAQLGARRGSKLTRLFWTSLVALTGFFVSVAAWNFVMGLIASNPMLGWVAAGLAGLRGANG